MKLSNRPWLEFILLTLSGFVVFEAVSMLGVALIDTIPVTLLSLIAFLMSMTMGWRYASVVVASYLLLGALGIMPIPVPPTHPHYGYLLGLLPAVFVTAICADYGWGRSALKVLCIGAVGTVLLHACGRFYMYFAGFECWWKQCLEPFFVGHVVKLGILAIAIPVLRKAMYPYDNNKNYRPIL